MIATLCLVGVADRDLWSQFAYDLANPILSNLANHSLKSTMLVEGFSHQFANLEAFGRLMDGISLWITLPDDHTPEAQLRDDLRRKALKAYTNIVNPSSPDYATWRSGRQPLVDGAFLASSFIRASSLWYNLTSETQNRYVVEFMQLRRVVPGKNNWVLFSSMIETFLMKFGFEHDLQILNNGLNQIESFYIGDGMYSDGDEFRFDYYNSYVIQPMYLQILDVIGNRPLHTRVLRRMQRYATVLERFISPECTFPMMGRSMTYRLAVFQPLSLLAYLNKLPLPEGQVRAALTCVLQRFSPKNFDTKGFLRLGFNGHQPGITNSYTNTGSLYIMSEFLIPLGLQPNATFWTALPLSWTSTKAYAGEEFPIDGALK